MKATSFLTVLMYIISKTFSISIIVGVSNLFNKEGQQQMIGFSIIIGIISLILIYISSIILNKIIFSRAGYIFYIIGFTFLINEISSIIIEPSTNFFSVFTNNKSWQIVYKVSDVICVLFFSWVFFIIPTKKEKSKI